MIKICEICKVEFNVKPSHFEKRKCCSKKCQNINQKNKTGNKNNNYKGGPKLNKCLYCKNDFISNNPYQKRKYCSHNCSAKASVKDESKYLYKKEKIKNRKPRIKKINKCNCGVIIKNKLKYCKNCKSNLYNHLNKCCKNCNLVYKAKVHTQTFCSKECHLKYKSNKYLNDKNPNWKGGVTNKNKLERNSKQYIDWRNSVFIRDEFVCQDCGQIGGNLHAHHIKSFAKFKELRYDINNGLTLCFKCHKKIHGFMFNINEKYKI